MGPMNAAAVQPVPRLIDLPDRGGAVAAYDFGRRDGPVDVVFSHANGFNAWTYRSILQPLAGLRILAFDLRGHGASTLPAVIEGRRGWSEMADDLLAVLAAETDAPVVLAGHSMGGTTSLLATAAAPERVRSLALFDPVILPGVQQERPQDAESPLVQGALRRRAHFPSREAALESWRGRGAFRSWSEAQLADYVAAGLRPSPDGGFELACAPAWEASNYRTHNYDPVAAFRLSRRPVRVLAAEQFSTVQLPQAERADLTADGRIRIETVPGTSHFLPMERPDLVQAALLQAVSA